MEQAAAAVRRVRDPTLEATVQALYARHPEWDQRWGLAGREATERDVAYHLDYLEAALRHDVPEMFEHYAAWLRDVLETRDVPSATMVESFHELAAQLRRRLPREQAGAAAEVLEAGARAAAGAFEGPFAGPPVEDLPGGDALLEALLDGDWRRSEGIVREALAAGAPYPVVADRLVAPVMREVGRRWQGNRITVAQEHLATAIAQGVLARAFVDAAPPRERGGKAVFACVEGNLHSLGLRLVADAFELQGWDVEFLGADVPTRDLVAHVRARAPAVLGLSVSLPQQLATAAAAVQAVRRALGEERPFILVGGLPVRAFPRVVGAVGADAAAADALAAVEQATRAAGPQAAGTAKAR